MRTLRTVTAVVLASRLFDLDAEVIVVEQFGEPTRQDGDGLGSVLSGMGTIFGSVTVIDRLRYERLAGVGGFSVITCRLLLWFLHDAREGCNRGAATAS